MHKDELAHVSAYDAVCLMDAIYASFDQDKISANYLRAIPNWIQAEAYGFYLFDARTGQPKVIRAVGVSDRFLQDYEEFVRPKDPLLRRLLRHPRPLSTDEELSERQWRRHVMAELFRTEGLLRYMLAPLVVEGRVVGTINFARRPDARPFDRRDLAAVNVAARHLSRALECSGTIERERRNTHALRQAFHAVPIPVVVTRQGQEPFMNRAAERMVAEMGGLERLTLNLPGMGNCRA